MIRPVPGLMLEQQPDAVLFRLCLYAEARGEPVEGMLGVAHVIANRARAKAVAVGRVILARAQFSWTLESDPQHASILGADHADPLSWGRADAVAGLVEKALAPDPTGGADHYYNPAAAQPAWGRGSPGWRETVTLGNHVFGVAA